MLNYFRQADLAIDLGTSKIAVFARGEGVILEEPACIAFRELSEGYREVIAVGHDAAKIQGKAPKGIVVTNPIRNGVISDCMVAGILLRTLLGKILNLATLPRRRFLVGTLYGANSMEQRAFEQVVLAAGAKNIRLVAEPLAAAIGAELPIDEPRANMVVDIGGGAAEAIVVSLKSIVCGGSIRVGGDAMCEAIVKAMRLKAGLEIGLQEAKRLKEIAAGSIDANSMLVARGFDVSHRRPSTASVPVSEIREALTHALDAITAMVRGVVDQLPAELSADLLNQGLVLTGGGAFIEELADKIEEATHVVVKRLNTPQQAVINGCGRMLDYFDYIA